MKLCFFKFATWGEAVLACHILFRDLFRLTTSSVLKIVFYFTKNILNSFHTKKKKKKKEIKAKQKAEPVSDFFLYCPDTNAKYHTFARPSIKGTLMQI